MTKMNELAVAYEQGSSKLAISDAAKGLIKAGVSENTLRAYRRALDNLAAWLNAPLSDAVLGEYVTHLHAMGKAPSTIAQVVAAVKWQAKNVGQPEVVGAITLRILAGIRREGKERGRGQVGGITWRAMESVCAHAEASKTLAGYRDSALIRLMSDCLLRISEAVAVNVEDLDKVLTVRTSKTDQEGEGAPLYVGAPTHKAIRKYRERGNIESGALFRRIRRGGHITEDRLTVRGARNTIKRWAAEADIDGFISGHSLRVGSAVSLAQAGATLVDMQTAGRWKNPEMPAHYAKAEFAERGAVARFRYGK